MSKFMFNHTVYIRDDLTLYPGIFETISRYQDDKWEHYRILQKMSGVPAKHFSSEAELYQFILLPGTTWVFPTEALGNKIGLSSGTIELLAMAHANNS